MAMRRVNLRHRTLVAVGCVLLSSAGLTACSPSTSTQSASSFPGGHGPPTSAQCVQLLGVACYAPKQLRHAYDLGPLYARGFDGAGRTIVIVEPFGSPTIRHDLATFDRAFGLPAPPSFRILQPVGAVPPFNRKNAGLLDKAGETTGDVELAHEIAPGASILLVETPAPETISGGGFARFMAAENYVIAHNLGDVISQSFGLPEPNFGSRSAVLRLRYAFVNADRHHVTVLAASNDFGVTGPARNDTLYTHPVVNWPASDPLVTGVGGTTLHLTASGRRISPDTAWNDSRNAEVIKHFGALPWAAAGGLSAIFTRPAYQDPVSSTVGDRRGVPDVALSASLSGGVDIFESYTGAPGIWAPGGGTSAATPEFAGLVAIADQYANKRLGLLNPALYRLEQTGAPGLVNVTSGGNTVTFTQKGKTITVRGYRATAGYNLVTGVGTIDAALFIPELADLSRS
jgi:subtilase family serine protease